MNASSSDTARRLGRRLALSVTAALTACFAVGCGSDPDGPKPWDGTLGEGLAAMATAAEARDFTAALALGDRLRAPGPAAEARVWLDARTRGWSEPLLGPVEQVLDTLGVAGMDAAGRAEVEYARGLTLLMSMSDPALEPEVAAKRSGDAIAALGKARAEGGGAGLDAIHVMAGLELMAGEAVRQTLPEISGGQGMPAAPAAPGDSPKDDSDPLEVARAHYLGARAQLAERLTFGTGDPDAAANMELCIRRLRELDDIERQREEQKQEQEDQEKQDGDPSEDESKDEKESSEDEASDENEPESGDESEDDQEQEEPNPEDAEPEDPEEKDPEEDESKDAENPEDEPEVPEDAEADDAEAKENMKESTEEHITLEELKQRIQKMHEHEERGEELKRVLRMKRKVPTEKDW